MKILYRILPLLFIVSTLLGCMDVVDVDVPKGETLLAVEGSITNQEGPYTVKLTYTAPYFDQTPNPVASGALVRISDNKGFVEDLEEVSPGVYQTKNIKGEVGNTYTLYINVEEEEYQAVTEIKRVSLIDSLVFEYQKENKNLERKAGYIFKYYGPEIPGVGDYYRFKTYRNDTLFNSTTDLVFTNDELVDGNYIADLEISSSYIYQINDKVKVEGVTITQDTYYFFLELFNQINNANAAIFANPVANVRTNIVNLNPSSKKKAVGYFYGAGVFSKEGILKEDNMIIK